MFMLKIYIRGVRVVSVVMMLALILDGFLAGKSPLLAQPGETVSNSVYQNITQPPGTADSVYGGRDRGRVEPKIFLNEDHREQQPAPVGDFTVAGNVYENSTGMPLTGVTVKLLRDGHPTQFTTSSDGQGGYIMTGVGSGDYSLTFQHPGFTPEQFEIEVNETVVRQDCNLFRNTSIKGRIVNKLGESLEGVQVTLADQNLTQRNVVLSTDTDGLFYLVDVPPGRYRLSVSESVYHEQKMIWVDEYPQELEMVLEGPESISTSVPENGESPANDEPPTQGEEDNGLGDGTTEQSGEGQEGNGNIPDVGDGTTGQPGEEPDGNSNITDVGDGVKEPTDTGQDGNNNINVEHGGDKQPDEGGEVNTNSSNVGDGVAPEFPALKELDPLFELDKLLKKQTSGI